MAVVQHTIPWSPNRHQSYQSPIVLRGAQYASNQAAYAYSHASHGISPTSNIPFVYHWDQQPQHFINNQHWNHTTLPPCVMTSHSPVLPMPQQMANHRATSSGSWQNPNVFWQPSLPHLSTQITAQQSAPISPQHGPPRRPVQSKHALWVGNIPSNTPILALRDHFLTPETAQDILSVIFTPASNSGFVNFRSDEACRASMKRFNKSFLYGVPLNCRSRKPTINNSPAASRGPASHTLGSPQSSALLDSPLSSISSLAFNHDDTPLTDGTDSTHSNRAQSSTADDKSVVDEALVLDKLTKLNVEPRQGTNRYFIIKSLTLDDLMHSVRTRRWSTQAHNEHVLDEAFKSGDSVYLIFSVNRSREYFGYAQMTSATNYAPAPVVTSTPLHQVNDQSQLAAKPPIIRTPAIGHIPAGRIVDELCRGKIFWEIDGTDQQATEPATGAAAPTMDGLQKSFTVEWLCVKRIPFRQTTHLRNSFNENKEVKIARDGTELDPEVGRRLCSLFLVSS